MGELQWLRLQEGKTHVVLLCGLSQEPGKQQLYDIPASPRKAERGAPAGQPSVSMTGAEIQCSRPAGLWAMC